MQILALTIACSVLLNANHSNQLFRSEFRFIIVENDPPYGCEASLDQDKLNKLKEDPYAEEEWIKGCNCYIAERAEQVKIRRITILMEPGAFSRKNLIKLAQIVKEEFPCSISMDVNVYTSLEQLFTPEEGGIPTDSPEPSPLIHENDYDSARLRLKKGQEDEVDYLSYRSSDASKASRGLSKRRKKLGSDAGK